MASNRLTRRTFVGSGLAAAGALGLSPLRAAPGRYDVAIIGAGLAGMHAAMTLAGLGARVVVLEASQRPGGRCLTADDWFTRPDLGGAQIGTSYARVLDTARRLGLALGPGAHVNAPYSFVLGDQLVAAADWPSSPLNRTRGAEREVPPHALGSFYVEQRNPFEALDGWLQPAAADYDMSVAAWLSAQGASAEARRLISEGQGGGSLDEVGVLRMLQEATRAQADLRQYDFEPGMDAYERAALTSFHIVGGTSRLTDAMAESLGDNLRLEHAVTALEMDDHGCTLRCANGAVIKADRALAAVPFTVLRRIAITPGLQGHQADAVANMTYGNQSQVWLRVKAPYWEEDGIEASMWTDGPFTLIRQQIESDSSRAPDRSRVLVAALAFSGKARRIDAMPAAERGRFAIAEIERIRPSTRGQLEFVGAHSWAIGPHAGGCSFQLAPGRALAWAQAMDQPHERLYFAGEHLRRLEVGMEAAMESGERAAFAIATATGG